MSELFYVLYEEEFDEIQDYDQSDPYGLEFMFMNNLNLEDWHTTFQTYANEDDQADLVYNDNREEEEEYFQIVDNNWW